MSQIRPNGLTHKRHLRCVPTDAGTPAMDFQAHKKPESPRGDGYVPPGSCAPGRARYRSAASGSPGWRTSCQTGRRASRTRASGIRCCRCSCCRKPCRERTRHSPVMRRSNGKAPISLLVPSSFYVRLGSPASMAGDSRMRRKSLPARLTNFGLTPRSIPRPRMTSESVVPSSRRL